MRCARISIVLFSCEYCSWQMKCVREYQKWKTLRMLTVDQCVAGTYQYAAIASTGQCVQASSHCRFVCAPRRMDSEIEIWLLGKLIFECMKLTIYRCGQPPREICTYISTKMIRNCQLDAECNPLLPQVHRPWPLPSSHLSIKTISIALILIGRNGPFLELHFDNMNLQQPTEHWKPKR